MYVGRLSTGSCANRLHWSLSTKQPITPMETSHKPKICLRRCLRKIALTLVSLCLVVVIVFLLLVVWVATGPRSLQQFTPQITQEINRQLNGYRVELGDIELTWDGWQSPLDARFKAVQLYSPEQRRLANLEQVAVSANMWALFSGRLVLDRITLFQPVVNVYRKPGGRFALDLGYDTSYGPELPATVEKHSIAEHLQDANLPQLLGLSSLNIKNGSINLGDTRQGVISRLRQVNLTSEISQEQLDLTLSGKLFDGKTEVGALQTNMTIPMDSYAATGSATFENINPLRLSRLDPQLKDAAAVQLPISGAVSFALGRDANVQRATFDLSAGKGRIITDQLEKNLTVESLHIKGYMPSEGIIVVEDAALQTDVTSITGQGKISQNSEGQMGLALDVAVGGLPMKAVKDYWPPAQSPESRTWVTGNITQGNIRSATLKLDIKPGMLDADRLPNEAVDAAIVFDAAEVKFYPSFDPVTRASGVVNLNANELNVAVSQADFMTATKIRNASVSFDDLNADNPNITIGFEADMPAKELARVLGNSALDIARDINLTPENVSGNVVGKANISFPYELPRGKDGQPSWDAFKYDISATLKDVSQRGFLEDYDLSKANGTLNIVPETIHYKGRAALFGTPLTLDVEHHLRGAKDIATSIHAVGTMSESFLKHFDAQLAPYVTGSFAADAKIQLHPDDSVSLTMAANLLNAKVNVAELGWNKAKGVAAKTDAVLTSHAAGVTVSSLDFYSGTDIFEGSLALDAAGDLQEITATKLTLGSNNLQLSYAPIAGGYKIYAKGDYFDASTLLNDDDPFSFKKIPALDVMVDIKKLVIQDDRYIENLTGKAECNPTICTNVAISGKIQGSKPVMMAIGYKDGARRLKLVSEDAGGLLSGFNIYDNMKAGNIEIDGVFDDASPSHPLTGKLLVTDFQVYGTPTLARIVSLASFGGILDAIEGNGLSFKKLRADFVLKDDVINVTDLRSTGDSTGITADGEINLVRETLFLKGTVIPSYTINSMLKDVPLVGEILTGGDGIIAATYKLSGPMEEPEVSVNPLSALAPGFLRKIFE